MSALSDVGHPAPDEPTFFEMVEQLDEIEQVFLCHGIRLLHSKQITAEQFTKRFDALMARHDAGEKLTTADLEAMGDPQGDAA